MVGYYSVRRWERGDAKGLMIINYCKVTLIEVGGNLKLKVVDTIDQGWSNQVNENDIRRLLGE